MWRNIIGMAFAFLFCVLDQTILAKALARTEVIELDANWEFAQAGSGIWREATVPGTVHQDLIRYGDLPDPFFGTNEDSIQWVEEEDWEYRTSFIVTPEQQQRDEVRLLLDGLDTYADVYLNGALVCKSENMFVGHAVSVKDVIRVGENHLYVYFHSPIRMAMPQFLSNGFNYPADNDHRAEHLSVFTRKAPYCYGWDWGIRMVTSGIWRSVRLLFSDVAVVTDYHVQQLSLTDAEACLSQCLELDNVCAYPVEVVLRFEARLEGKPVAETGRKVILKPGANSFDIPMNIADPKRWMPNGWGQQTLYDMEASVMCGETIVAESSRRIGLRTLRVVNEADKWGKSFYFEVNGVPMFAKGANYIPQDALPASVSDERYRTLLQDVKEANMNMIRVWGGGIYERDLFYDLADELGILVWQDFQFACTPYPSDPAFLQNVSREADYQIRRLRNHACLAMWCGNNEIEESLKYWGFQRKFTSDIYAEFMEGYDRLFRCLLPHRVEELDAGRFYLHSSPAHANWGRPHTWGTGDSHNWGVWYGQKPFESLDTDSARFMSEFGFQSFPEMKTIATFANPTDYSIDALVMQAHQKSSIGNELIQTYMEWDYRLPCTFDDFVYVGMVMQGQGIRRGLEAHRRMRPYCMGTLYWQLNDSWPVVSWSGIDYYGNWKALHYQARRAFEPLLIHTVQEKDSLEVYLISDCLEALHGLTLSYAVYDFQGKMVKHTCRVSNLRLPGNTSKCVQQLALSDLLSEMQQKGCYLQLILVDAEKRKLASSVHYFKKPKELQLPEVEIKSRIKRKGNMCELILSASALAKDVFVEVPWQGARLSDNFFDLLPGERKRVVIQSPHLTEANLDSVHVHHLRQTYIK